jgi:hypothetical protein
VAQVGKGASRQPAVLHLPLEVFQALESDVLVVVLMHARSSVTVVLSIVVIITYVGYM